MEKVYRPKGRKLAWADPLDSGREEGEKGRDGEGGKGRGGEEGRGREGRRSDGKRGKVYKRRDTVICIRSEECCWASESRGRMWWACSKSSMEGSDD